jgi:hypothetical protein
MLFIFSTPVLIRHRWQLETVVFLHWCLILAVLLYEHHLSKVLLDWAQLGSFFSLSSCCLTIDVQAKFLLKKFLFLQQQREIEIEKYWFQNWSWNWFKFTTEKLLHLFLTSFSPYNLFNHYQFPGKRGRQQ